MPLCWLPAPNKASQHDASLLPCCPVTLPQPTLGLHCAFTLPCCPVALSTRGCCNACRTSSPPNTSGTCWQCVVCGPLGLSGTGPTFCWTIRWLAKQTRGCWRPSETVWCRWANGNLNSNLFASKQGEQRDNKSYFGSLALCLCTASSLTLRMASSLCCPWHRGSADPASLQ